MKKSLYLFVILGMLFTLQSCQKDDVNGAPNNLTAPSIPPAALFTIPTQSFGVTGSNNAISTRNDKSNWIHAGLNVLAWNTVVFVNTAVPLTAFGKAFDYDPVYLGDLTWEWAYQYQAPEENGATKYDVSLTGQYISDNNEVVWTMVVNVTGDSNKFTWYEGIVSRDHSSGLFTLNENPQNPNPYMSISFAKKEDNNDVTIRFSNIKANDPGIGDYIEWRTENGNEYDRAYDVFNKNSLLEIQASGATDKGRVRHPSHFNDNEWHCWNAAHNNIDC
jgi:hypothetical protein